MNKVYFDQNVWDYIVINEPIQAFKKNILSNDIEIYFGTGNIYEYGRILLTDKIELLKKNFSYLWEFADILKYIKEVDQLIKDDLNYAKTGGKHLPYLSSINTTLIKQEIFRLSKGDSPQGKDFIKNREQNIKSESAEYIQIVKKQNPTNIRDDWPQRHYMLETGPYNKDTENISDSLLFTTPGKFPYINTYINAQLYINYSVAFKGAKPNTYTSDFRHLISANTTGCFVTMDERVIDRYHKVCPYINIVHWNDFKNKMLTSQDWLDENDNRETYPMEISDLFFSDDSPKHFLNSILAANPIKER